MEKMIPLPGSEFLNPFNGGFFHQADCLRAHVVDFLFILDDKEMPGLGIVSAGSPQGRFEQGFKFIPGYLFGEVASDASSVFYRFEYGIHSFCTPCRAVFARDFKSSYATIAEKRENCYTVHKFFTLFGG